MSLPRPSLWLRIRSNIGPLTLLSVLTSVAFNRALLARERNEQYRLHRLQMSLLQQILSEATSTTILSSSVLSSLDEQRRLARRMRALQLNPFRLGFSAEVLPSAEEEEKLRKARVATTSWSSALFRSGVVGKVREAIGTSTKAIRERGFGLESKSTLQSSAQDEEDEKWFRALEESLNKPGMSEDSNLKFDGEDRGILRDDMEMIKHERDSPTGRIEPKTSLRESQIEMPTSYEASASTDKRRRVYL